MNHTGGFVWTFPKITVSYVGGPFVWPSSPALADINPDVNGLELIIGNRYHGNVWAFDGDNTDGVDEGITITAADFSGYPYTLGTEGVDWDVLWKFDTGGSVWSSPAVGDVDNDGTLEVVVGSDDSNVYVLDGPSGIQEHAFSTGGAVRASAALANMDDDAYLEIVIGSTDGNIYVFQWDGANPSTEWTFSAGGAVYSSAAIGDIDLDGDLEIVVGSTNGSVYSLSSLGGLEWNYATGGAVYSSPALADRGSVAAYDADWPMFRHDVKRTGFYGAAPDTGLDVYVGSDDNYLYLLSGTGGLMIDRFETYGAIHTSPSVADVDGDNLFDIFFYDWGTGSTYAGHTFWALEDTACTAPIITATIDIDPDTLNLKSNGQWITAYIELPDGYDVANIDVSSIVLTVEGADFYVDPEAPTETNDGNGNGVPDLMVKFDRSAIRDHLIEVDLDSDDGPFYWVDFDVTGTVGTTSFSGTDVIKVRVP